MKNYLMSRKKYIITGFLCMAISFLGYIFYQHSNIGYHGFKLIEEKKIDDIGSIVKVLEHKKSGAHLIYLQNDDDNKVFSINFRTPPYDNTGIPHILEHSVFCGSRKYPVKDIYVELNKSSLNTFLNAATAPDYTMYPLASLNEKEFRNLMDVYLDAVFYPNIYSDPEIFRQEAWHYELEKEDEEFTYKGVVFNEMKGVYSSPSNYVLRNILNSLFPDTVYSNDAGGDPAIMTTLTREKVLDYHKKYYHPSNAYIYLYGNINLKKTLKFLDRKYLKHYKKKEINSQIPLQNPFPEKEYYEGTYPVSVQNKQENNTYLTENFVIGESLDCELNWAFEILNYVLLGDPKSPLRKALTDAGIGENISGFYESSIRQPFFGIVAENAQEKDREKFEKVIRKELERIVEKGLDKELIETAINKMEFSLREANLSAEKGLFYNEEIMNSWLYEGDPTLYLEFEKYLNILKKGIRTDYYEGIISKYLLNNPHCSLVVINPEPGMLELENALIINRLKAFKKGLTEKQVSNIMKEAKDLKTWQSMPDKKEDIEKIPHLSLKDIHKNEDKTPIEKKEESGVNVLYHDINTNDVAYIDFYFDTTTVPEEKISYLYLLAEILGNVNTSDYSYEDLARKKDINTGGINYQVCAIDKYNQPNVYYPKLIVSSKALIERVPELFAILNQEMNKSKFDDYLKLKKLIKKIKLERENQILENSEEVAISRVLSYFNPASEYNELGNLSFYQFICDLDKNFDSKSKEIIKNLDEISKLVFNKQGLLVSVTCNGQGYTNFQKNLNLVLGKLSDEKLKHYNYHFKEDKKNEGILTPQQVQYVVQGNNINKFGFKYNGSLKVLENIINNDYLWNKIRMQGGAYSGRAIASSSGNFVLFSYRDPNLKKTIRTFNKLPDYLKNFTANKEEMSKYIIGTIGSMSTPLSAEMQGKVSTINHIRKLTPEDVEKINEEVLNTDAEKIRELTNLIDKLLKENFICVIGNESKLESNKDFFNKIINIYDNNKEYN